MERGRIKTERGKKGEGEKKNKGRKKERGKENNGVGEEKNGG